MQLALTAIYALRIDCCMEHLLHIWPRPADLAADLRKPYQTVAAWVRRGRIPADYDQQIIEAAARRGHVVTLESLAAGRRKRTGQTTEAAE